MPKGCRIAHGAFRITERMVHMGVVLVQSRGKCGARGALAPGQAPSVISVSADRDFIAARDIIALLSTLLIHRLSKEKLIIAVVMFLFSR